MTLPFVPAATTPPMLIQAPVLQPAPASIDPQVWQMNQALMLSLMPMIQQLATLSVPTLIYIQLLGFLPMHISTLS